jgi:ssDNA-binding Zn-finger/Zn-ribbon topoisomerase 1
MKTEEKDCPECGEPLTVRKNRTTDELFLACTGYPSCRYTEEIDDLEELDDI